MNQPGSSKITRILNSAALLLSIIYIVLFIIVAVSRISYPFELNWMEGGMLSVVERILDGENVYTEPSLEYVPFIYTPLYYYISAFAAKFLGPGFLSLRLVSLVSALLCIFIIYLFVRHETRSDVMGIMSAGLFAAFYEVSGNWLDIARIDSLNLFLLLLALYIIRFYRNNRSYLLAGIILFLAFFTRQTSIILVFFILIYGIICNRKIILPVFISTAVLITGSILLLDRFTDNRFTYFVFELPVNHHISISQIILFWTRELFRVCLIPLAFIIYYIISNFGNARKNPGWRFNLFAGAGMVFMGWFLRIHSGSMENALLPALTVISIFFGISLNNMAKNLKIHAASIEHRLPQIVYILLILQFLALVYDPRHLIPSRGDMEAGNNLVNDIREIDGEILIPGHGYLAERAGKKGYAHTMAVYDVYRTNNDKTSLRLQAEIASAFDEMKFAAIIYDDYYSPLRKLDTDSNYVFEKRLFTDDNVFYPVAGTRIRPEYIFAPKQAIRPGLPIFELFGPMPLVPLRVPGGDNSTAPENID